MRTIAGKKNGHYYFKEGNKVIHVCLEGKKRACINDLNHDPFILNFDNPSKIKTISYEEFLEALIVAARRLDLDTFFSHHEIFWETSFSYIFKHQWFYFLWIFVVAFILGTLFGYYF